MKVFQVLFKEFRVTTEKIIRWTKTFKSSDNVY
jgi:hypothetical protein